MTLNAGSAPLFRDTNAAQLRNTILSQTSKDAKVAEGVGGALGSAEKQLWDAFASGDEKSISQAQIVYQKAVRVFESFTQILRNAFQLMMELIRGLSLR